MQTSLENQVYDILASIKNKIAKKNVKLYLWF